MAPALTKFRVMIPGTQWRKGSKRSTQTPVKFYVTSVSWATTGAGYDLKTFRYNTAERGTPFLFSKIVAEAIVEQITTRWRIPGTAIEPVEVPRG